MFPDPRVEIEEGERDSERPLAICHMTYPYVPDPIRFNISNPYVTCCTCPIKFKYFMPELMPRPIRGHDSYHHLG